ncbi:uncharacterized protein LOC117830305 isoform X2 [Notolabrus celidotus]|nr:uncharacterized protein LOC117830305 isoform X2 [Notolabrus celidotus]
MTRGLKGHTVTCGNFFTSHGLSQELLRSKIALVGAMRNSKPELPPKLLRAKEREVFSSLFGFDKTHTVVSYIPKRGKNVILLSSKHRGKEVKDGKKKKPVVVTDYNSCKGAVHSLDKAVSKYSCRRKTIKWSCAIFYHIIDVSANNAFVLWNSVDSSLQQKKSLRRRFFLEELGKSLVTPLMAKRPTRPREPAAASMVESIQQLVETEEDLPPAKPAGNTCRKQCMFCKNRKRVWNTCCTCGGHVCKGHMNVICKKCFP